MAIENEIVRFIAEIDLDPQDAAKFQSELQKCEESASVLRKQISDVSNDMAKMRAEGKETSEAYKELSERQKSLTKDLKENTKRTESYTSALGINKMSMNQLVKHAKQLRSALNATSKEANPQLWNKLNKELLATEKRMDAVAGGARGIKEPLLSLNKIKDNLKTVPGIIGMVTIAFNGVASVFRQMTEQTQVWGDKWQMTVTVAKAGWDQFIANLRQGRNVIKQSISDAMAAAREAQGLEDELFERNNSLRIKKAEARGLDAADMAIANDSSKPAKERLAALDRILAREKDIAETEKSIAEQELSISKLKLKRTGLTDSELKTVVDYYEKNRNVIKQAEEYNALLAKQESYRNSQAMAGSDMYAVQSYGKMIDDISSQLNNFDKDVVETAKLVRQYNLSNDDLIKSYVDATVHVSEAKATYAEAEAAQARKRGTLNNQIESENYSKSMQLLENHHNKEMIKLTDQLTKKEITEKDFNEKSLALELVLLESKKKLMEQHGKDVSAIELQIAQKFLEIQKSTDSATEKSAEGASKAMEKHLEKLKEAGEDAAKELEKQRKEEADAALQRLQYLTGKAQEAPVTRKAKKEKNDADYAAAEVDLQEMYDRKLISEEEFQARKSELIREHARRNMEIELEAAQQYTQLAADYLNEVAMLVSSIQDAEYARLDSLREKELTAAGDDAEKRQEIEEKYEAEKLKIQQKYADIDMGIKIAQTISAGALAVMVALAQLGPIAGGIMGAIIAATTAAQVATIVMQRNAIKNASTSSSGSVSAPNMNPPEERVLTGYSEGGYTGDGGRYDVAGVVHRGEYVVPQPELRDPAVAAMVASIENRRLRRTSANAMPGFADGGYTSEGDSDDKITRALAEIIVLLRSRNDEPIPAYVALSDITAAQETLNLFKSSTSLKKKRP